MTSPLAVREMRGEGGGVKGDGGGRAGEGGCGLIDCTVEVSNGNWTHMYACKLSRMDKNIHRTA